MGIEQIKSAVRGIRRAQEREQRLRKLIQEWKSGARNCGQMLQDPVTRERVERLAFCARELEAAMWLDK